MIIYLRRKDYSIDSCARLRLISVMWNTIWCYTLSFICLNLTKVHFSVLDIRPHDQIILLVYSLEHTILTDVKSVPMPLLLDPLSFLLLAVGPFVLTPPFHESFAPQSFLHFAVGQIIFALAFPYAVKPLTLKLWTICPLLISIRLPAVLV